MAMVERKDSEFLTPECSVIDCGLVHDNGTRYYSIFDEYFGEPVEVFFAVADQRRRRLYKPSQLAKKLSCTQTRIGMFLSRMDRKVEHGIYKAISYVNKPEPGQPGLRRGVYFVSKEVCQMFENAANKKLEAIGKKRKSMPNPAIAGYNGVASPGALPAISVPYSNGQCSSLQMAVPGIQYSIAGSQFHHGFVGSSAGQFHHVSIPTQDQIDQFKRVRGIGVENINSSDFGHVNANVSPYSQPVYHFYPQQPSFGPAHSHVGTGNVTVMSMYSSMPLSSVDSTNFQYHHVVNHNGAPTSASASTSDISYAAVEVPSVAPSTPSPKQIDNTAPPDSVINEGALCSRSQGSLTTSGHSTSSSPGQVTSTI